MSQYLDLWRWGWGVDIRKRCEDAVSAVYTKLKEEHLFFIWFNWFLGRGRSNCSFFFIFFFIVLCPLLGRKMVPRVNPLWHTKDRFTGFWWRVSSWGLRGKLQNFTTAWLLFTNSRRSYMAEILLKHHKTLSNQSINLSHWYSI